MVSFSCEACGDILTKKKLDAHHKQCRGASFTCVDCMVHFKGTDYRSHTSCMTEAQKYQGALYKEKSSKNQRKGNNNNDPKQVAKSSNTANTKATVKYLHQPSVEKVPDASSPRYNAPAPPAPTPPIVTAMPASAVNANSAQPVNVFDYLVTEDTPEKTPASSKKPMQMVNHAPSLFEPSKNPSREDIEVEYERNGFSYGTGPIEPSTYQNMTSNASMEFTTPIPKKKKDRSLGEGDESRDTRKTGNTSDKKRKRENMEDSMMTDAPPSTVKSTTDTPVPNHSGLTGGLDRMLRIPSLDDRNENNDEDNQNTSSPIKRTRRNDKETNRDPKRSRAERFVTSMLGLSGAHDQTTSKAIVRPRRNPSDSSEVQKPKKTHHRSSQGSAQPLSSSTTTTAETTMNSRKSKRKNDNDEDRSSSGRLKRSEYRRGSRDRFRSRSPRGNNDYDRQMAVHRHSRNDGELQHQMAVDFLSLVTKGPESGRGMSVHKALKRLHSNDNNGRDDLDLDREQQFEDDREMWRALRLKRNERGEVVLFV